MKIVEPGHVYELNTIDSKKGKEVETLRFVNREDGSEHPGTQTQEVIRTLIDRTKHCDNCRRWAGNDQIIHHLRMALVLHEARALIRKAEKGLYQPEHVMIGQDGHFQFVEDNFIAVGGDRANNDAEIYLRKDKDVEAEDKPAQYHNMFCTRD